MPLAAGKNEVLIFYVWIIFQDHESSSKIVKNSKLLEGSSKGTNIPRKETLMTLPMT